MGRPGRTRATRAALTTVFVALALVACGRGGEEVTVVPVKVKPELVPAQLAGGELTLHEDGKADEAFARLADNALVADGKLYAIRQGERLVATLQLSTLVPEVDLTDRDRYNEMATKLLPGVKQELSVADVSVFEAAGEDKVVYLWFGRQMFEVLQVKSSQVEPEAVLAEIIAFQQASPAWDPLPRVEEDF